MIFVLIDQDRGTVHPASLETLAFAFKMADELAVDVEAVTGGQEALAIRPVLGQYGVARIHIVTHDRLVDYAPRAWARGLIEIIQSETPKMVMAPATDRGNEVLAYAAALMNLPLAANCIAADHSEEGLCVTRYRWGSSLLEESLILGSPQLLTIAPNVFSAQESSVPLQCRVSEWVPRLEDLDLAAQVAGREEVASSVVSLQTAPVVIGGGRGMGGEESFSILERLAELLGGAVGGSRVATNNGWRPHSDQIGLTGNRIAPELYIACGISGAIQHLVGCKGAKHILVINNDPDAPFFARADYGVVGDLHEILPALLDQLQARSKPQQTQASGN